ncbi:hypothetical protein AYI68_g7081, partial [Smittium mucronatum]
MPKVGSEISGLEFVLEE